MHRSFLNYEVATKAEIIGEADLTIADCVGKSFHVGNYCFDSNPERQLFWDMLHDNKVSKIWFTGMLTHGQSYFVIHYVDTEVQGVRSYYPDFLIQKKDGSYVMIEVKRVSTYLVPRTSEIKKMPPNSWVLHPVLNTKSLAVSPLRLEPMAEIF
ncbi:hypothetical protein [Vibrio vulnificus]|uniref:hypothetical protein n=1 Tax=Vibrio vulnificus TaxID=672 RepID=UPI0015933679|nr:hypothetical protein [Vibrio vulnificus]EJE8558120.1 hypothetical protein [Vibrio vulnificus]